MFNCGCLSINIFIRASVKCHASSKWLHYIPFPFVSRIPLLIVKWYMYFLSLSTPYSHYIWVLYTDLISEYSIHPLYLNTLYIYYIWVLYTAIISEYSIQPLYLSSLYSHYIWVLYTAIISEFSIQPLYLITLYSPYIWVLYTAIISESSIQPLYIVFLHFLTVKMITNCHFHLNFETEAHTYVVYSLYLLI